MVSVGAEPELQSIRAAAAGKSDLLWGKGREVADLGAGARRRTEELREAGRLAAGAMKTDEAVVFNPPAQTVQKQLQVGCFCFWRAKTACW